MGHTRSFRGTTTNELIFNTVKVRFFRWHSLARPSDRYAFVLQHSNKLNNLTLDCDIMIFISSDGPIIIQNVHLQRNSFLVVGEMSAETIARIAKMIGAEFSGGKGIYKLEKLKN